MKFEYTQMREDANEHPLDIYNKLSKSQQRLFTFLMKRRNNENQCKITGVEIAEQMGIQPQLVSLDIKTIMNLDMIRKGRHSLLMINPHMWIFGEWHARNHAIELWNDLPQTSNRLIIGGIKRYR